MIAVLLRLNPNGGWGGGVPAWSPVPSILVSRESVAISGGVTDTTCERSLGPPSTKQLDPLHPDALQPVYGADPDNPPDGPYFWEGWVTWQVAGPSERCTFRYVVDITNGPLQTGPDPFTGEDHGTLDEARALAMAEGRYIGQEVLALPAGP